MATRHFGGGQADTGAKGEVVAGIEYAPLEPEMRFERHGTVDETDMATLVSKLKCD